MTATSNIAENMTQYEVNPKPGVFTYGQIANVSDLKQFAEKLANLDKLTLADIDALAREFSHISTNVEVCLTEREIFLQRQPAAVSA